MKHTVIKFIFMAFIFLFLVNLANALEFSFNSPSSVKLNEEFKVKVFASTTEVFDVKIYVKDFNDKVISEIYDQSWKSSFYFVKESFPSRTEYSVRVTKAYGSFDICVKLRKSEKTTSNELCSKIEVEDTSLSDSFSAQNSNSNSNQNSNSNSNSESANNYKNTNDEEKDNSKDKNNDDEKENNGKNVVTDKDNNNEDKDIDNRDSPDLSSVNYSKINYQYLNNTLQAEVDEGKIILNNPIKDKIKSSSTLITKESSLPLYLLLAFSIFAILVTILLALRKL
ncbi:hypothetical protein HYW75_03280 [Candidatus Pacearchaeota archaeon]|nr:hypothetical protein [Candidatus Pacearchaeota archaeon]